MSKQFCQVDQFGMGDEKEGQQGYHALHGNDNNKTISQ